MKLRNPLEFKSTRCEGLNFTPAENLVAVLRLAMPLSVENATALEVDWAMAGTIARDADIALGAELEATEFSLPGMPKIKPDVCHKLKLSRTKDAGFELRMICKIPIFHGLELYEFFTHNNKDTFTLKINSLQGELFEGGKRVALSGKDAAAGKDEPEEIAQDDNAARQTLVTHRGNGKGHALPFDTTIAGAKASAAGKRRSART